MPRMLVVDDSPEILRATVRALRRHFPAWEIVDLASSVEAIRRINTDEPFDMVITDLEMPGMFGDQVVMATRRHSPKTLCVFYSADQKQAREANQKLPQGLQAAFAVAKGGDGIRQLVSIIRACEPTTPAST